MSDFVKAISEIDFKGMEEADEKLSKKGITMTEALNHFFKMINEYGYIPYYDEGASFNQETIDAIREGEDIISGKVKAKIYDTAEEAIADLMKD